MSLCSPFSPATASRISKDLSRCKKRENKEEENGNASENN